MSRIPALLCLALLAASCNKQKNDEPQATQRTELLQRPIVSIIPVIDNTQNDLPWSLSEELTSTLEYRLLQQNSFYLTDPEKIKAAVKKLGSSQNPFGNNLGWMKKTFLGSEFVVFMQLIEHNEAPTKKEGSSYDSPADLNMSMRVRVVDLRGEKPAIVLQELIHDSHHIPKQFTRANFHQVEWGKGSFSISPMGLAHAHFTKEIASRLEDYILISKNKTQAQSPRE